MKTNNTTETKNWSEMGIIEKLLTVFYIVITIVAVAYWFFNFLIAIFALASSVVDWAKNRFGRDDEDDDDGTICGLPYTGADKETRDAIAASFLRAAAAKGAANAANEAAKTVANSCEAAAMDVD